MRYSKRRDQLLRKWFITSRLDDIVMLCVCVCGSLVIGNGTRYE